MKMFLVSCFLLLLAQLGAASWVRITDHDDQQTATNNDDNSGPMQVPPSQISMKMSSPKNAMMGDEQEQVMNVAGNTKDNIVVSRSRDHQNKARELCRLPSHSFVPSSSDDTTSLGLSSPGEQQSSQSSLPEANTLISSKLQLFTGVEDGQEGVQQGEQQRIGSKHANKYTNSCSSSSSVLLVCPHNDVAGASGRDHKIEEEQHHDKSPLESDPNDHDLDKDQHHINYLAQVVLVCLG